MDRETADALAALNRSFYRERAEEFAATREAPWPGWERVLECAAAASVPKPLQVLDVGCGNARFARFLDARLAIRGETFGYVGVDASPALLARARARRLAAGSARLLRADWDATSPERALPAGRFSLIALFGVLHHVPGRARRRALVSAAAGRLAVGGLLALSVWQLEAHARLRRRLVPWSDYERRAARPLDPAQLEPGDHLVRWGDPRSGSLRYCHFADEAETATWTAGLDLEPVAGFRADGREGDLNRYLVFSARA